MNKWIKCKTLQYISQNMSYIPGEDIVINADQIISFKELAYGSITNNSGGKIFEITTQAHNLGETLRVTGPQLSQIFDNAEFALPSRSLPLPR